MKKTTEPLKQLWQLAFGDSAEAVDAFFRTAYAPSRCHSIATEGETAAALYWLDGEYRGQKLAYIYAVATHPDHRGRGLCRTLMAQTHEILAAGGYYGAILHPAEPGLRRMYAGMDYQQCSSVSEFSCAAGSPVSLREVGPEEYTCLRRKFLPENGVLQEGASIAYLHTYARFYAGTDFLLAAAREGALLHGIELLGNRDSAPGILAALNCTAGSFRTPGMELPFAMFHSLRKDAAIPGYLGLAFD